MSNQSRKDESNTESDAAIREMCEPPGRLGAIVRRLKLRAATERAAEILARHRDS
jgi:hypothetical protein